MLFEKVIELEKKYSCFDIVNDQAEISVRFINIKTETFTKTNYSPKSAYVNA